ncbi:MAG: YihY/virulence factor BrkB family protein [Candidatus Dormibacteria bacterium]
MKSLWARIKRWLPLRVVSRYLSRNGPNQATLISWNMLFAFFPIMVLAADLASLVPRQAGVGRGLTQAIASALPGGNGTAVVHALDAFHHSSGLLAVVGILGLLWSGSSLFGAMDQAFANLSHTQQRPFIFQKLMAFGMIVLFACLVVPVVLSSSLLAVVASVPGMPSQLTHGPLSLGAQVLLSVVVGTGLFCAIYFFVPQHRCRARAVLPGAVTAAILFEALSLIFPLYFKLAHGFSTYGTTFSLFFLILAYVFFLSQITVLGYTVALEAEPQASPAAGAAATAPDLAGGAGNEGRKTPPPASPPEPLRLPAPSTGTSGAGSSQSGHETRQT